MVNFRKVLLRSNDDIGVGSNPENIKTLQREIYMARNIQTKLLNGEKPSLPAGEVSGVSVPARLIGGDYFDFYQLANEKIRIIIGDVMGKGIPAAMLMILTRGAFRSATEVTEGPGETLTAMNNAMFKDLRKLRSFVTVFCADWDPKKGSLVYANAGHNLPVIVRANFDIVEPPGIQGVMLGGLPDQVYKEEQIQLQEEDLVFFYTDGIIEAQNRSGEMFKLERLVEVLIKNCHLQTEEIEQKILEDITVFTEGLNQRDDITMVALKVGKETDEISSFNSPLMVP